MAAMRPKGMLQQNAKAVKSDIEEILGSGNYYVTEEIARELTMINNALEHLSLDDTFLSTSSDWQRKPGNFSPTQTEEQLSGAMSALNQTGAKLYDYKNKLSNQSLAGKQENQLRELHQWAVSSLRDCQKHLEGLTMDAADRIKQFGDTIGVTDRYTGYRQNLTRGNRDPFRLQSKWVNKSDELGLMNSLVRSHTTIGSPSLDQCVGSHRPSRVTFDTTSQPMKVSRGYRTVDSLYPKSASTLTGGAPRQSMAMDEVKMLNALNASDHEERKKRLASQTAGHQQPYEMMSVQEQAGINTTFPGRTEYMQRYKAPDTDVPTCDFLINPSPNFGIFGRPLQKAVYVPSFTEYQTRYDWPDSEKIVKLPWLRN